MDGCNRVTGSYELTGKRVRFGRLAGTQMACVNSPGTERPSRDALSAAARVIISGDRLELDNESGTRLAVFVAGSQGTTGSAHDLLDGTSWQLVRFQGGDGSVVTPDDRAKYTVAFEAKGSVAARVDCNRGRGTWKSSGASQMQFGPLALTRAKCPPGSLHDQIVKQWGNIRSYVLKDGHLFLSLMADGGIYEFEPVGGKSASFRSPVRPKGPTMWRCGRAGAESDTLRVTFYPTEPAFVLLDRGGVTKPAFQVTTASGARYEGDDVSFWEARGEATLSWMGVESTCKPN
jgi:heat shock protein HslJ